MSDELFEERLSLVSAKREMTEDERSRWAALIETEERVRFWGHSYTITPKLVSTVWGNGEKWMHLTPLNTRPNYYVLRVDSRLGAEGWPEFADICDDVYNAIEDEFGRVDDDMDEDDSDSEELRDWPAADFSVGSSWGDYDAPTERTPAEVSSPR